MHPRITESLSVIRNAGYLRNLSNVPAAFRRRPSRIRLAAAAATVAGATLFGVAAAAGGAGAPAPAAAGAITARTYHGVSPAVAAALTGQPASQTAAVTAAAKPAQAAHGTHVTVAVKAKAAASQPRQPQQPQQRQQPQQAAGTGHSESVKQPAKPKAAPARQAQPYRIYDSVTPSSIPAREAAAVYSNGQYSASPSQTSHLGHALWIDVTGYNYSASVLDVEPGDATPSQAASWVWHRLRADHNALVRLYTFRAQWPAVKASVATLPRWMQERVHWWIADPTGVQHMVPGADATQWYWGQNYDLSVANPGF